MLFSLFWNAFPHFYRNHAYILIHLWLYYKIRQNAIGTGAKGGIFGTKIDFCLTAPSYPRARPPSPSHFRFLPLPTFLFSSFCGQRKGGGRKARRRHPLSRPSSEEKKGKDVKRLYAFSRSLSRKREKTLLFDRLSEYQYCSILYQAKKVTVFVPQFGKWGFFCPK